MRLSDHIKLYFTSLFFGIIIQAGYITIYSNELNSFFPALIFCFIYAFGASLPSTILAGIIIGYKNTKSLCSKIEYLAIVIGCLLLVIIGISAYQQDIRLIEGIFIWTWPYLLSLLICLRFNFPKLNKYITNEFK